MDFIFDKLFFHVNGSQWLLYLIIKTFFTFWSGLGQAYLHLSFISDTFTLQFLKTSHVTNRDLHDEIVLKTGHVLRKYSVRSNREETFV